MSIKNDNKLHITPQTRRAKLLCVLLACTLIVPAVGHAQIVTNTNANMDFGKIDFSDTHNGTVQLGTDGNVQTSGSGMVARNDGNAGRVKITQPDTGIIDVKCATSGELVDSFAPSLDIQNIEIAVNTGVVFGSGIACLGILPANPVTTSIDMDVLIDPDVLIGGEVPITNISPFPVDNLYSTSGGGTPIRLSITIQ